MRETHSEIRESGSNHIHRDFRSLALQLDSATEDATTFTACPTCRQAYETVQHCLQQLEHPRPHMALEFINRHELYYDLLGRHPSHGERLDRVRSEALYHHWGLCRLLLQESRAAMSNGRFRFSLQQAELASEVAAHLDSDLYSAEWVADLRAEASATRGDIHRLLNQLLAARKHIRDARYYLAKGTHRRRITALVHQCEYRVVQDSGLERSIPKAHLYTLVLDSIHRTYPIWET